MSLRQIFDALYAEAALCGEARRQLGNGAAVRVRIAGDETRVVLARRGVELGAVELGVFVRDGQIPQRAERWPVSGQSQDAGGWYRVAYRWRRDAGGEQAELFEDVEAAPSGSAFVRGQLEGRGR